MLKNRYPDRKLTLEKAKRILTRNCLIPVRVWFHLLHQNRSGHSN